MSVRRRDSDVDVVAMVRHGVQDLSEAEFQSLIAQWAKVYGWQVHAQRAAQYRDGRWATHIQGVKGFPDLVLCRPPRLIFAELKVKRNKPSREQETWIAMLDDVRGIEVHVWRPEQWSSILATLSKA